MEQQKNYEPAYITIVEGPPPEFREINHEWPLGVLESQARGDVALCEMRTMNGPKLAERCHLAWRQGRAAYFDFPAGDGTRGELSILAVRWEEVEEGHKLHLWLKI